MKDLKNEIGMLKRLKHDNIVSYYFSEKTDKTLSIFMEYVSGVSLIFYYKTKSLQNVHVWCRGRNTHMITSKWFRFIIAKIYNILRYVIARLLRHICNLHIKRLLRHICNLHIICCKTFGNKLALNTWKKKNVMTYWHFICASCYRAQSLIILWRMEKWKRTL